MRFIVRNSLSVSTELVSAAISTSSRSSRTSWDTEGRPFAVHIQRSLN